MIQNHGDTRDPAGGNPVRRQEERIGGTADQCPEHNLDIGKQNLSKRRLASQHIVKTPEQKKHPLPGLNDISNLPYLPERGKIDSVVTTQTPMEEGRWHDQFKIIQHKHLRTSDL